MSEQTNSICPANSSLVLGQALHEPNSPIMDVLFVDEGIVSLTASTHDNGRTEVGLTGREGFVGASAVLNPEPYSVHRAFTEIRGGAFPLSGVLLPMAALHS
jgi:CRP-like cAMP-binding protein